MVENDTKVKNWFTIQSTRVGMFVKNHKYVAAAIGLFLISAVVAIVAFASDQDPYEGTVVVSSSGNNISVTSTDDAQTNTNRTAKSYSTVIYDIPYHLSSSVTSDTGKSNRTIKLIVKLPKTLDAEIFSTNDTATMFETDNSNNIYTIYDYANVGDDKTSKIYMDVYNAANGTIISPEVSICESTTAPDDTTKCVALSGDTTKITIVSEEIELIPKTVTGIPYNIGENRYVPFGIVVGINSDSLVNGKLTGKYFSNNYNIYLQAKQAKTVSDSKVMEQSTSQNYFGLYTGDRNGDVSINIQGSSAFPLSSRTLENSTINNSVYNSGNITYSRCESDDCRLFGEGATYVLNVSDIKAKDNFLSYTSKGYVQDFNLIAKPTTAIDMEPVLGVTVSDVNNKFLALGSYYITGIYDAEYRNSDVNVWNNLAVKYKYGSETKNGLSYFSIDSTDSQVLFDTSVTVGNEDNEVYDSQTNELISETVAYGEIFDVRSVSSYKVFNSGTVSIPTYNLTGKIPVSAISGNSSFELVEYSEEIAATPYYLAVNKSTEQLDQYSVQVSYITCTTACDINVEGTAETTYDTYEQFIAAYNAAKTAGNPIKLSYIKYRLTNIPVANTVDFRIKLKVGTSGSGRATIPVYTETTNGISSLYEAKIDVTPFKSKVNINVNNMGSDLRVDISENSNSRIAIYPTVSIPAISVDSNSMQLTKIDSIKVRVNLPDGITYVPNNDYKQPLSVSANNRELVYEISNQKVDTWIDPIYIDVNYAINVSSNTPYTISAVIESSTVNNVGVQLSDISLIKMRTAEAKITFINSKALSYSLKSSKNAIGKDERFDLTASIYNRSGVVKDDLDLFFILPHNDGDTSSFNGNYTIDFGTASESILCTSRSFVEINNETAVLNSSVNDIDDIWGPCNNADNVTAIKIEHISLASNALYSHTIGITPKGAEYSDHYKIKSYVVDRTKSEITEIPSVKVYVESLKVSGLVWEDFDGNGTYDSGEFKIPDVELQLYDSTTSELIKTVHSNSEGKYIFDKISPESIDNWKFYIVANFNTAQYALTKSKIGSDRSIYSSFSMVGSDDTECTSTENRSETEQESSSAVTGSTCKIEARTETYTVEGGIHLIGDINLGLSPRKEYSIKMNKYISSATVTNALGVADTTEYGKVSFAKLDVKNIGDVKIKVTYSIEVKNTGYFPGYVYKIKDIIPDGMVFNSAYAENSGWSMSDNGYIENISLSATPLLAGETKYITLSLDLIRKEAGSFVNNAIIDDSDLQIFSGTLSDLQRGGASNEE